MGTSNIDTKETTRYKMKYKKNPYISNEKNNSSENINNSKEKEKDNVDESSKEEEKIVRTLKVKIKFESGIWEKEYKVDTTLKQIDMEFKKENNLENINDNNYIEYTLNNSELIMDSTPLKNIINEEEQNEILIEQIIKKKKINYIDKNVEYLDYIAKPLANPFEVYIFDIRNKIIKKIIYTIEKVQYLELDKYGENSAYCNGINHLFISGGIEPKTNQIMNLFLDIDIENNKLKKKLKMPIPKKNHKMIYFNKKVYIIGGDEEKTMFYDTKNMRIMEWNSLNQNKFETSLIIYDSYLFCFDLSGKHSIDYDIEKIDLSNDNSKWEIVRPEISPDISNIIYSNKLFGLIVDRNENIIFLGGKCDINDENNNFNLLYNVKENTIEKNNEIKVINNYVFKDLVFIEKSFLSFDENTQIIFPDFSRGNPKVLYYYKDRKCLEIILYHSNKKLKKAYNNKNNVEFTKNNNNIDKIDENNFNKNNIYNSIKKEVKDNKIQNIIKNKPNMNDTNIEGSKNENDNDKENIDINSNNINEENIKKPELNNVANDKHSKNYNVNSVSSNNEINSEKLKENNENKNGNDKISNSEENNKRKGENIDDSKEKEEKEKNKYKGIIYDYNKTDFHSSVDYKMATIFDKLNNNKAMKNNIKKLNIIQPKETNVKILKKARRQIDNYEISESDDLSNY